MAEKKIIYCISYFLLSSLFIGHPMAGDCVFFDASNANGWWLTIGMAQRSNDIINLFFILKVPGLGTFVNEELTQTSNVKVSIFK